MKLLFQAHLQRKQKETSLSHLEDLPVDIQHVDGDLHVLGDALPAFLELPLLQRDVKVIPHFSCRTAQEADGNRLCMPARFISDRSAARQRFVSQRLGGGGVYISRIQSSHLKCGRNVSLYGI